VEEGVQLKKEYYLAFLLDRKTQKPIIVYSKFGGMDIEEGKYFLKKVPKKDIHICQIDP
jgi:succinyl-CoA synthetase beta subunit